MRKLSAGAALLAVLALAGPASAAGGGEGGWTTLIFQAINLALLIGLLVYFAGRPIRRFLGTRAETVTREVAEATRLHAEARAKLDEYEARLASLQQEAEALLAEFRREGEAEKERLVAEAKAEAERITREAERTAAYEVSRARARLEAEVVDRAVALAEQLLREKMTPADIRRLTTDYLTELEGGAEARQPQVESPAGA